MKDNDFRTLTSKIGRFYFPKTVPIIHAQLVRDTVTGQWLSPHDREMELYSVEDAYKFMNAHQSNVLQEVEFELQLNDEYARAASLYKAGLKTSHFGDAFKFVRVDVDVKEYQKKAKELVDKLMLSGLANA